MWPIDQILGLMTRLAQAPVPCLVADEQGFSLFKSGTVLEQYSWDEVGRIVAFKRDRGTYDEIWLVIDLDSRAKPLELSEEVDGYADFVRRMV